MFYYLKGKITRLFENFLVIDTGGVGYKVYASENTVSKLQKDSESIIYTYVNKKEDVFDIYGFLTEDELSIFEKLISVSGVGPKAGLSILSVLPPAQLLPAIAAGDAKAIAKAPGIGSKTAQRIILELKGKIDNDSLVDAITKVDAPAGGAVSETVDALVALGYSPADARKAASFVQSGNVEKMIKDALRVLMQGNF